MEPVSPTGSREWHRSKVAIISIHNTDRISGEEGEGLGGGDPGPAQVEESREGERFQSVQGLRCDSAPETPSGKCYHCSIFRPNEENRVRISIRLKMYSPSKSKQTNKK